MQILALLFIFGIFFISERLRQQTPNDKIVCIEILAFQQPKNLANLKTDAFTVSCHCFSMDDPKSSNKTRKKSSIYFFIAVYNPVLNDQTSFQHQKKKISGKIPCSRDLYIVLFVGYFYVVELDILQEIIIILKLSKCVRLNRTNFSLNSNVPFFI